MRPRPQRPPRTLRTVAVLGAMLVTVLAACSTPSPPRPTPPPGPSPTLMGFTFVDRADGVTDIRHNGVLVAEATDGARTVTFFGPERAFTEVNTTVAVVKTDRWVRVAPRAWHPGAGTEAWFADFMLATLSSDAPDILAMATQYLDGRPTLRDASGIPYAGDAGFGLLREGDTVDGADFFDYLGIPYTFPDGTRRRPDPRWYRKLDCSGYLRLVYGYRAGIPLSAGTTGADGLPRTAHAMAYNSAAVTVAEGPTRTEPPKDLAGVRPGDLVFFALRDDEHISHSGIVLGRDDAGRLRFVSSRTLINGPTFGDFRARSVLDAGLFRDRLRRVIRL